MKEVNLHAMQYGLNLAGLFLVNFIGSTFGGIVSTVMQVVMVGVIVVAVYMMAIDMRDRVLGGVISYWKVVVYVVRLFLYASLLLAFCKYIFYMFISPDFLMEQYKLVEPIYAQLVGSEGQDVMAMMKETATNAVMMSINSVWLNVLMGFVLGLMLAKNVKREVVKEEDNM